MNPDVLRQLVWRHESKLQSLARDLVGERGCCLLRDAGGQLLWSSRPEVVPVPAAPVPVEAGNATNASSQTEATPRGEARVAGPSEGDVSSEVWTVRLGAYGLLELHPDPEECDDAESPGPGIQSGAGEGSPSGRTGKTAGLLSGPFGPRLESFGALLAAGLETEEEFDQLVEEHISNTNQLVALYNIINETHETWDLGGKLVVMIEEAGRQTGATLAAIEVDTEEHSAVFCWPNADPEAPGKAKKLLERVRGSEDSFLSPDQGTCAAVPIRIDDERVGWLAVADHCAGDTFKTRDLKLLGALADLTAGFLLTSRLQEKVVSSSLFEKEIEIASQIQDMLMPKNLPEVPGLELAAACIPAQSVGGDFYVVQRLPGGRCAFAIGDVTGKGVPAALIMAMTRTVFRSLGTMDLGPGEILQRLSDVLFDDLEEVGKFVTMLVGIYDHEMQRLEIANAGHSPVFYAAGPDDELTSLEPKLPPLGVFEEMNDPPLSLPFPPGAMLVVSSDGITEARTNDGEMFEERRFLEVLRNGRTCRAAELKDQVLDSVRAFTRGAPQSDDQTLVVCKGRV